MDMFTLKTPTQIIYGRNILESAINQISETTDLLKGNVVIVTTGGSLYRYGYIDSLNDALRKKCNLRVFDQFTANPKLDEIESVVLAVKDEPVSCVIGFGGGSALDAAKAVAAGAVCKDSVTKMFHSGVEPEKSLPIIAIPTTAGTGSELSKAAILTDEKLHIKGGLRGKNITPQVAIVDSLFTETIPLGITMETGFDVIAHAMESYVSRVASPYTEMLSEYVLCNAGKALRILTESLDDVKARGIMSYCSMLMGINLANASTALPHRMQYPLGAHSNSSHGAGLAVLYPAWMKYEEIYAPIKTRTILNLLDISSIEELLELMYLRKGISDLVVGDATPATLTGEVTGNTHNDPAFEEPDVILKIYKESWEL